MTNHGRQAPPGRRSVGGGDVGRAFRYGTGFVGLVLVALFVQKSDGNSAFGTIGFLAMATVGSLLLTYAAIALKFRGRQHEHRWAWAFNRPELVASAALVGIVGNVIAFVGIDIDDSDFQPAARHNEVTRDAEGLALRNLTLAEGLNSTRLLVSVINTTKAPMLADAAEFDIDADRSTECLGNIPTYKIDSKITVRAGRLEDAQARAAGGPLDGFPVEVQGRLVFDCEDIDFTIKLPINIALDPQQTTSLALDVPTKVDVTLVDLTRRVHDSPENQIGGNERVKLHLSPSEDWDGLVIKAHVGYASSSEPACIAKQLIGNAERNVGGACES